MSAHNPCTCGRKRGDRTDLVVLMRNHNCSAFNGYHWTPSDYSLGQCTRPHCTGMWRTKAAYVNTLPNG